MNLKLAPGALRNGILFVILMVDYITCRHCQGNIRHDSPSAVESPGKIPWIYSSFAVTAITNKRSILIKNSRIPKQIHFLFHLCFLIAQKGRKGKKMKERLLQNDTFWIG